MFMIILIEIRCFFQGRDIQNISHVYFTKINFHSWSTNILDIIIFSSNSFDVSLCRKMRNAEYCIEGSNHGIQNKEKKTPHLIRGLESNKYNALNNISETKGIAKKINHIMR